MVHWLSRDGKIIFISRSVRAFALGFISLTIGIYLQEIGLSALFIGLALSAFILGGAFFSLVTGHYAAQYGIRKMFLLSLLISFFGITIFILTRNPILLLLASFLAFISPSGRELGPFLSLEQAYLPSTIDANHRTKAFSYLNIVDGLSGSVGTLLGGLPVLLQKYIGVENIFSFKILFILYLLFNLIAFILYMKLPNTHIKETKVKLTEKSKKIITKLSLLFSIDSFGGGLVLDSIIALWFHTKFHTPLSVIAAILFIAGLGETFSFYISGKVAARIGLIKTMVFTHIPSSICLIIMPFMPTFYFAAAFYVLRQLLSEMDIPARQSYVVSVVEPQERAQAASITNVSKIIASSVSPPIASKLLLFPIFSPFVFAGTLKIIYDLTLYFNFRKINPKEY